MTASRKIIFITSIFYLLLLLISYLLYIANILTGIFFYSMIWGASLALFNFIIGLIFLNYGISKAEKIFLVSLWGGMLLRLILMLVLVVVSLKFLDLSIDSFIFSILFFYIYFLISEILYLNLRKK